MSVTRPAPGSPEVCYVCSKKGHFKDECPFIRSRFRKVLGHRAGECSITLERKSSILKPKSAMSTVGQIQKTEGRVIGKQTEEEQHNLNTGTNRGPIIPTPKPKSITFLPVLNVVVKTQHQLSKILGILYPSHGKP